MIFKSKAMQLNIAYLILALFVSVGLIGCASVQMPAPTASIGNLEKLKSANIIPVKVGKFALASGKSPDMDVKLDGLRGSSVKPSNGTFSQQLKDELIAEIKAAGLYDEASNATIEAQLTDSKVDAAIKTGTARLAAHFTIDRTQKRVFDKELAVDSSWESSFVGAIAIPAAINQYTALYKSLIQKLIDDPDFRAALQK